MEADNSVISLSVYGGGCRAGIALILTCCRSAALPKPLRTIGPFRRPTRLGIRVTRQGLLGPRLRCRKIPSRILALDRPSFRGGCWVDRVGFNVISAKPSRKVTARHVNVGKIICPTVPTWGEKNVRGPTYFCSIPSRAQQINLVVMSHVFFGATTRLNFTITKGS